MATVHLGPAATAIERRGGRSERGQRNATIRQARRAVNAAIKERSGIEQEIHTEQKKPRLEDLPIEKQVQVWDEVMDRTAAARQEKAVRVAHKASARLERRDKAYRALHSQQPQEPVGLLAAFKRKAFEASHTAWNQAYGQARQLVDQAQILRTRVYGAAEQMQARGWAFRKMSQAQPDMAERVQAYRREESRKRLEQQQRERQAKREQQKGRGLSR